MATFKKYDINIRYNNQLIANGPRTKNRIWTVPIPAPKIKQPHISNLAMSTLSVKTAQDRVAFYTLPQDIPSSQLGLTQFAKVFLPPVQDYMLLPSNFTYLNHTLPCLATLTNSAKTRNQLSRKLHDPPRINNQSWPKPLPTKTTKFSEHTIFLPLVNLFLENIYRPPRKLPHYLHTRNELYACSLLL